MKSITDIWSERDIILHFKNQDVEISSEDAIAILDEMIDKYDPNFGYNYNVVDSAWAEVKMRAKQNEGKDISFSSALDLLKAGARVCRKNWNGKNMWLELQMPTDTSKMTVPYVYMKTADDQLVPWLCSQTDMLSNDWQLA